MNAQITMPGPARRRPTVVAVIAAGGTGSRMKSRIPKQFLPLAGQPILVRTLERVVALEEVAQVIIPLPYGHQARVKSLLASRGWRVPIRLVRGGPNRQESVRRALVHALPQADLILVHDAVRPLCEPAMMRRVLNAAWERGAAVPAVPATETIQRVSSGGRILPTPPREELRAIQTPQCFRSGLLRAALDRAHEAGFVGTDESSAVRRAGHQVVTVRGDPTNIKITHPLDLSVAELMVGPPAGVLKEDAMIRTGLGIDYHRLVEGRRLVLGGVDVPFEKGLEGHSDADVLTHAICDALLGAAALGDIGRHFPDSDPAHRGRRSLEFLAEVGAMLQREGWQVRNIDAVVVAQQPLLAPFMHEMRAKIAGTLGLQPGAVNIKATSTEGMNAEGCGEGLSAHAVALIGKTAWREGE